MAKEISQKMISKKRKFVKDGVFYAELNDFLARELAENGYAGCEIRVTPKRTEVTIKATQVLQVVGENGRRIRELTALVQKRFKFPKRGIFMYAEKIQNKGLSALAQAQAVKFRLLQGLSVRRAAYSVVQFIMNKGAQGCEVIVSGKLRGQRAKGMKFKDGFMIHAGDPTNYYIDQAVKHVHLRQGVIGIKVKIMLPYDDTGTQQQGVKRPLPDMIDIPDPIVKDQNLNDDNDNEQGLGGLDDEQQRQQPIDVPDFGGGGVQGIVDNSNVQVSNEDNNQQIQDNQVQPQQFDTNVNVDVQPSNDNQMQDFGSNTFNEQSGYNNNQGTGGGGYGQY